MSLPHTNSHGAHGHAHDVEHDLRHVESDDHDSEPGPGHGELSHGGHGGHGHGGHGHGHGGHGHGLAAVNSQRAFVVSTTLNLGFVLVEFTYGAIAASTALVADAAHNLGDVLGLLLAWGASRLHQRGPTRTRTYGYRKSTVLASLTNALLLVFTVGAVVWEAVSRFGQPQAVDGVIVLWVAAVGVLINFGSAWMFMRGAKRDLNLRGAYLHMLADGAVSLAVVAAGLVLSLRPSWVWVDPVVSIGVSALVLWGAWGLLREALHLTLDGVPDHLDADAVRATLAELPGVVGVADLHVWAMSTSESALTAHLVVDERAASALAQEAGRRVREVYGIDHATIQIDVGTPDQKCAHC